MSEVSVTIKNQSIRVTQKNEQIIIRTVVTNTLQSIETPRVLEFACSDEVTALTTGQKISLRISQAMTITAIYFSLVTAQTAGSTLTIDIKKNGVSIFSTKVTIDNNETDSSTAATPYVLSTTLLSFRDVITVHVDQVGTSPAGLKCSILGS